MTPEALQVLGPMAAFLVGACVGSFLNVCIYRIPLNRSVILPGSHCAACGAPIPPHRNVPIASWLLLRGRAACCGTRIDARYAMVEFGTGLIFLALWMRFGAGDPLGAVIYAIMTAGLIAACLIDLDHFIIPDRFTFGGCIAGFIACAIDPRLMGVANHMQGFTWSLASAMIGALVLSGVGWIGTLIFRKEAMGMGDVKFIAAICAFLGAVSLIWTVVVSAILGAALGLILILRQRGSWGTRIPYGPFLGLAAVLWLFGGYEVTHAYLNYVFHMWNVSTGPLVQPPGMH
jgi:leader peptidase (prepilin peptidase)/N-methyltransferase